MQSITKTMQRKANDWLNFLPPPPRSAKAAYFKTAMHEPGTGRRGRHGGALRSVRAGRGRMRSA